MGFSCFLCRKPFQEVEQLSQKGAGDGQVKSTASATTCGHLFHSECLQAFFKSQSHNAWAPKTCPVCTKTLDGLQDVIRVRAYPYDDNGYQRPAIDQLNKQLKQMQLEKAKDMKQYEAVCQCNEELRFELENKKREYDEMTLRCEQLHRLNKIHAAEAENLKAEIEKLKNMIIKLTEKITGTPFPETSIGPDQTSIGHNGISNSGRMVYPGDLAFSAGGTYDMYGSAASANSMVNFNGSLVKPSNLSHPPGFMLPFMQTDPVPELSSGPGGQHRNNMLSVNQDVKGGLGGAKGQGENATSSIPARKSLPLYARVRQENVGSCGSSKDRNSRGNLTTANLSKSADNATSLCLKQMNGSSKITKKSVEGLSLVSAKDSIMLDANKNAEYEEFDGPEVEGGKWHEKRNKRRTSSKGRGGRSSLPNNLRMGTDDKRYGYFKCGTCKAEWGSSKSVLNQAQTCRYCKTEVHPYKQDFILSRKQLELKNTESPQQENN